MKKVTAVAGIVALLVLLGGIAWTATSSSGKGAGPKAYTGSSAGVVVANFVSARTAGKATVDYVHCIAEKGKAALYVCAVGVTVAASGSRECVLAELRIENGSKTPTSLRAQGVDPNTYCPIK